MGQLSLHTLDDEVTAFIDLYLHCSEGINKKTMKVMTAPNCEMKKGDEDDKNG